MKILFLWGNDLSLQLADWLVKNRDIVKCYSEPIDKDFVQQNKFDLVISYSYRYIISHEVISAMNGNIINLHISYLPWNRGACPNQWSFIEDTPKGVTIHYVDEKLDKGDIIAQKLVTFHCEDTLDKTYQRLNEEIISLFKEIYPYYSFWQDMRKTAKGKGTYHSLHTSPFYQKVPNDYQMNLDEIIKIYKSFLSN